MKISIVIPVLNEEQSIEEYLTKLQYFRLSSEIIIVDGGSKDNTVFSARKYADKTIISPPGRALQMNTGSLAAEGELLLFLHADTELPKQALNEILQGIKLKSHEWGRFNVRIKGNHPMLKVVAFFMNWRSKLTGIATGDQAIFVKKSVFERVGRFPEIALMEDIALSHQLKKVGSPLCLTAKVTTSGRRWEQFGIYKTILLMWSLRLRFFFGENPATLEQLYKTGELWKT